MPSAPPFHILDSRRKVWGLAFACGAAAVISTGLAPLFFPDVSDMWALAGVAGAVVGGVAWFSLNALESDLRRTAWELGELRRVTESLHRARSVFDCFRVVLEEVAQATGWDRAEAWVPRPARDALIRHPAAFVRRRADQPAPDMSFLPKQGVPGRVWASKTPFWVKDITDFPQEHFPLADWCREGGYRTVVGIPVVADEDVLAVLLFYRKAAIEKDDLFLDTAVLAADQLGLVLPRREDAVDGARAAALLNRFDEAVVATDVWLHVTHCNPAAERLYGWTIAEIRGRPAHDVFRTEFVGFDGDKALMELVEKGRFRGEVIQRRAGGTRFWVDLRSWMLDDAEGKMTGFLFLAKPIAGKDRSNAVRGGKHHDV
jgi:PAS domain S-box-containing protein